MYPAAVHFGHHPVASLIALGVIGEGLGERSLLLQRHFLKRSVRTDTRLHLLYKPLRAKI
jgi:hypothetical protein